MARSEPLCLCTNTGFFLSAHSGQLADREEIFTKFDKKCTRLESLTPPLNLLLTFPKRYAEVNWLVRLGPTTFQL